MAEYLHQERLGSVPPEIGQVGYHRLGDHWRPVQTCSFGHLQERHLKVATETEVHMVPKRAVHILLECFLVSIFFINL